MNIEAEFTKQNLLYDRYLDYKLSLPYDFDDIKIQANDTATYNLVNLKVTHLFDNFLYLYRNCKMASNVIPISSTGIAGVSAGSTKFTFTRGLSTSQFIPIQTVPALNGVDKTNTMYLVKNIDKNQYSAFTSNGKNIRVFNFDSYGSYISNTFSQAEVELGYGVLFSNITAFAVEKNYLFVLDSGLNRLVKYDATGFLTGDNVKENKLYYVDSIGNQGSFLSKTEFNNPQSIATYKDSLFVLDSGNSAIKKYDLNLNWKQTYRLYVDFLSAFPVDISADSEGNVYVLTENQKLFKYKPDITDREIIDLVNFSAADEKFKKIVFSKTDNNVFYLVSDKNVYKKLVSTPKNTVGKYLLYLFKYDIPTEIITSFATAQSLNGISDNNLLFSVSGNTGKFGYFYDNLNLFDILAVKDFDIYNENEVLFNKEEYIQNWVFNKNISKLIINHMRLRDQIIGKFIAAQDKRGNVVFRGTRYLLPDEIDKIYFEQDVSFYIGANEILSNNIVNRTFKKIYDIQANILEILQAEKLNYPEVSQAIALH